MLTISKPLSAGQARRYHEEEFQNARENYYSGGELIHGQWHGQLASRWGLSGEVREEHFARLAGDQQPETTGNFVAALFEHDSARPVNGYAAPQLHTHAVVFNLTETGDGTLRPLQPRELYRTQQYATAVYRSELAARLTALGYEIERGRSGQPEIRGYSREYLDASSPRRQQIEAYLAEADRA